MVFRIESGEDLKMSEVIGALREVFHHLGEMSRPWLMSFEGGLGVVRCSHLDKERVIQLLNAIRTVGSREVKVNSIGTSGTFRKALKKYVGPHISRLKSA
ncbi:MAG: Rpp14/Pop5 family protein [Thermoplasmata archaeon]